MKKLNSERRVVSHTNCTESGIVDNYEKREKLLDDMISQIDDKLLQQEPSEKGDRLRKDI